MTSDRRKSRLGLQVHFRSCAIRCTESFRPPISKLAWQNSSRNSQTKRAGSLGTRIRPDHLERMKHATERMHRRAMCPRPRVTKRKAWLMIRAEAGRHSALPICSKPRIRCLWWLEAVRIWKAPRPPLAVVFLAQIDRGNTGKLHPRVAAGLAPLLNLQLRALEATDLERRLDKVERLLARGGKEVDLNGHGDSRARDFSEPRLPKV